jgi:predicted transcriptional regulator
MSLTPTTTTSSYRDRIYMIEDIILKLVEYGELNQTALISFTGLNLKKHRCILDESESPFGKRMVIVYKPTQKGIEFCRSILEPYERIFPRKEKKESSISSNNNAGKPAIKSSREEQEVVCRQEQRMQQEQLPLITSEQTILQ